MKELREQAHMMALAYHEPDKIKDAKTMSEYKEQAAALGLETEAW